MTLSVEEGRDTEHIIFLKYIFTIENSYCLLMFYIMLNLNTMLLVIKNLDFKHS